MKNVIGFLASVMAMGVFAGEYHWTGATDSQWSEPGNWSENTVPGSGDTAIFGAIVSGASSTVTVDGGTCLILRITGSGAPAYNFVGSTSSAALTLENHGFIEMDAAVVNDQTFS